MHDSSQNDEIAQEVSCDSLDENMSCENLLYEVIDEERSESKCARDMCIGKCEVEKRVLVQKRTYRNLAYFMKF